MALGKGQSIRRHLRLQLLFGSGFTVASATTFALAWLIGTLAGRLPASTGGLRIAIAVGPFAVLEAVELARGRSVCALGPRRQTPKSIASRRGPMAAGLAWGLDTGTVISTYRTSAVSWAALGATVLGMGAPWLGCVYAAAFVVPLVLLTSAAAWSRGVRARLTGELSHGAGTVLPRAVALALMLSVTVSAAGMT
jgi:hypothetical protein